VFLVIKNKQVTVLSRYASRNWLKIGI